MTEPSAADDPDRRPGPGQPQDPFVRFQGRVLDPTSAVRLVDGDAPSTTAYRGDTLLVTAAGRIGAQELISRINGLADADGLRVVGPDPFTEIDGDGTEVEDHNRLARLLALAERTKTPLVFGIRLGPAADEPAPAVDVWPVLQRLRAQADEKLSSSVGLDHLMWAAADIEGNPFGAKGYAVIAGNPFGAKGYATVNGNPFGAKGYGAGVESYAQPGFGGHGPVSVVLDPPPGGGKGAGGRVVVLDTGVGTHPWFAAHPVLRKLQLSNGDPIGLDVDEAANKVTDPEGAGGRPDPMTGLLASHAGHGTFIAGLLRQAAPGAEIVGLRIMDADGVVPESALTRALLGLSVHLAEQSESIDALVLSLGYYAETGNDLTYTAGLKTLLVTLADRGVTTFAAAGNDCTQRPSFPAAFAVAAEFTDPSRLPLLSVAALNPDRSVALFSNDGPWVNAEAAGANVVSTAPVTGNGALEATSTFSGPGGAPRGTIDPDDFSSGFATWSGTSFAAPVLAGRFLAALAQQGLTSDVSRRREMIPPRQRVDGDGEPAG